MLFYRRPMFWILVVLLGVVGLWGREILKEMRGLQDERAMPAVHRLKGTVTEIDTAAIKVKGQKGRLVRVAFDENSKFAVKTGTEITGALREGDNVLMFLQRSEAGDWVVLSVFTEEKDKDKPAPPPTPPAPPPSEAAPVAP